MNPLDLAIMRAAGCTYVAFCLALGTLATWALYR